VLEVDRINAADRDKLFQLDTAVRLRF
jgi:hypothetical protein